MMSHHMLIKMDTISLAIILPTILAALSASRCSHDWRPAHAKWDEHGWKPWAANP